ncbi:MAG TPA: O-antigen ligase family protein [Rubrobacter sp.]|nr:O-antigen ligase family protein [Rubrobacter sp.]
MFLRRPLPAHVLLLVSFMGSFGFLGFYPTFHIELITESCIVLLYLWLALSIPIDSRWFLYIFLPAFGLAIFILLYAYVFTIRTGAPLLPSIVAQRYYVYFLIAPVTYALRVYGWNLSDFRRVFVLAMLMAMASRIVADFTLSPRSLLLSGNLFAFGLNQIYSDQAYLLRRLDLSVLFSALYFGRRALQVRSVYMIGTYVAITLLAVVLLIVDVPRVLWASAVFAMVLYGLFLARPRRARMFIVLLPLFALIIFLSVPQIGAAISGLFGEELSYTVRVGSSQTAWEVVSKHPLFGMGQDSAGSLTFQELFGETFFPSDVGLLGIAFQFGAAGLLLYLFFCGWLFVNLLRTLWSYGEGARSAEWTFLWALFIIDLAIMLGSPIQARFIKPEGLAIAAFSLGLLMGRQHLPLDHPRADSRGTSISTPSKSAHSD